MNQKKLLKEEIKLPIIDKNNCFMDLNKPSFKLIKDLLNHNVCLDINEINDIYGNIRSDCFCKILEIQEKSILDIINDNKKDISIFEDKKIYILKVEDIITNNHKYILFNEIKGILDLDKNYNEVPLDIDLYLQKVVRIINMNDDILYAIITDYNENLIEFAVKIIIEDKESMSYDLSYPINLIKKIELIN